MNLSTSSSLVVLMQTALTPGTSLQWEVRVKKRVELDCLPPKPVALGKRVEVVSSLVSYR